MFKVKVFVVLLIGFLLIAASAYAQQYRIMPLGNSITAGIQNLGAIERAGYRDDLAGMLEGEAIDFTMVGSQNDGSNYYPRHEGHPGWTARDISDNIAGWLSEYTPDVILLHIGTNDVSAGRSVSFIRDEIENIVDAIYTYNYNTIIFLASLIPRNDERDGRNDDVNQAIRELISYKKLQGYRIYYSAQNERFKVNSNWVNAYMSDYLHPNNTGYNRMAQEFYEDILSNMDLSTTFQLAGSVKYFMNDTAVPGVSVQAVGNSTYDEITDSNGHYEFSALQKVDTYNVTVSRPNFSVQENLSNFTISTYHAALTLRHSLGLENFTPQQKIAADVDKDGYVIAYDAGLIAHFAVGRPFADSHVGEWQFSPESRQYPGPNSDATSEDYVVTMLGDVIGAYQPAGQMLAKSSVTTQMTDNRSYQAGDSFTLTVDCDVYNMLAFDIICDFPTEYFDLEGIELLKPVEQFQHVQNITNGQLRAGIYGSEPTTNAGDVAEITLRVIKNIPAIQFEKLINYQERSAIFQYQIHIEENQQPESFIVHQNYPNPFNPETSLLFELPEAGHITIDIFNVLGQKVKTVLDEHRIAGTHRINWTGDSDFGAPVAAGTYICRFRYKNQVKTVRILKID